MNKIKENKNFRFAPVMIILFFFLRSFLLTERRYMGFEDLYEFTFAFEGRNIALVILLSAFAVLAGFVISKIGKKFGEASTFLSVLLIAEPLFFAKQMDCVTVFIADIGLLFILNALCEKRIIPNEVTLIVFLLVSCVLAENAIYLFVLPAVILYFAGDAENILKSTKKFIMLVLSAASISAGVLANGYLIKEYPAFENFIKDYTFFQPIYFKHISYENVLLFVFAVPTTALGVFFFAEFIKKSREKGMKFSSSVVTFLVLTAYILSIIGFVLKGSAAFFTINYIVPAAIFALVANKNNEAENSLRKVNGFIAEHSLAFVTVAVFLCFLSVITFYKEVDNIADFILSI